MKVLSPVLGLVVVAMLQGCDGGGLERIAVNGLVTFRGEPLPSGEISFLPIQGTAGPTVGASIADGRFVFDETNGPVGGEYRVEIRASRPTGRRVVDAFRSPPDNLIDEIAQYIPARYNSRSELTAEIAYGMKGLSFQLEESP